MAIKNPKNLKFICTRCGLCCGDTSQKTRHILLTEQDAEHIANATCEPIGAFAQTVPDKEPYLYEMHKTADGKCTFLEDNECTIYEVRPLICRFYPFELTTNAEGVYVFRETIECPNIAIPNPKGERLGQRFFQELLDIAAQQFSEEP